MEENEERIMMSVKTVCRLYDVGKKMVYEWFKRGLPKHKCGGTKIRKDELEKFISEGKA